MKRSEARSEMIVIMRRYGLLKILDATTEEINADDQVPYSRKTPYGQKKLKAELIHNEYMKHKDVFQRAFPCLRTLQIDDGSFSFKTAAIFPNVENLKIKAELNPDP